MLPQIPRKVNKRNNVQVQMRGLNFTDNYIAGELSDSLHISSEHFPYYSTPDLPTKELELKDQRTGEPLDVCWVYCVGNKVIYAIKYNGEYNLRYRDVSEKKFEEADEKRIGPIRELPTSTALLDNQLVLWPTKYAINLSEMFLYALDAEVTLRGVTVTPGKLVYTSMTRDENTFLKEDDYVKLTCSTDGSIDGSYTITSFDETTKTITFPDGTLDTLVGTHTITLERDIPYEMTYICEYGNRVWGSDGKKIFSSKQGNPYNFMDYSALADSAYFVDTIGEDEILACGKLGSACVFFGRKKMHKVIGNFPAEYQLYTYECDGITDPDSLVNVNENLFFVGQTGINIYTGSKPQPYLPLGDDAKEIIDLCAGTDGLSYYFSTAKQPSGKDKYHPEKTHAFYQLDIQRGVCILIDHIYVKSMAFTDNYLYFIRENEDGTCRLIERPKKAYIPETNDDYRDYEYDGPFLLEFKPIYEAVSGSYNRSIVANTFKRYHKLIFRVDLGEKSNLKIEIREDDKPWKKVHLEAGKKKGIRPIVVPIGRCDCFSLRLSGTGAIRILNMEREFSLGAER